MAPHVFSEWAFSERPFPDYSYPDLHTDLYTFPDQFFVLRCLLWMIPNLLYLIQQLGWVHINKNTSFHYLGVMLIYLPGMHQDLRVSIYLFSQIIEWLTERYKVTLHWCKIVYFSIFAKSLLLFYGIRYGNQFLVWDKQLKHSGDQNYKLVQYSNGQSHSVVEWFVNLMAS